MKAALINQLKEYKALLLKQIDAIDIVLELLYNDNDFCNDKSPDYFATEKECEEYLFVLRWNSKAICPYCGNDKVRQLKGNTKRYKCYGCRKQFSVKVGTIFHDTKIPLRKWFVAILLMAIHKKSISSHQLARDLGVTQKSAWLMINRITKQDMVSEVCGSCDKYNTCEILVKPDAPICKIYRKKTK